MPGMYEWFWFIPVVCSLVLCRGWRQFSCFFRLGWPLGSGSEPYKSMYSLYFCISLWPANPSSRVRGIHFKTLKQIRWHSTLLWHALSTALAFKIGHFLDLQGVRGESDMMFYEFFYHLTCVWFILSLASPGFSWHFSGTGREITYPRKGTNLQEQKALMLYQSDVGFMSCLRLTKNPTPGMKRSMAQSLCQHTAGPSKTALKSG